jgi:hypothetical protein
MLLISAGVRPERALSIAAMPVVVFVMPTEERIWSILVCVWIWEALT